MAMEMQIVEFKVRLHCKACEKAVRKALSKIKGIRCVEIDNVSNKITVLGYMEPKVVLKAIWKTGQRAELLPSSSSHQFLMEPPSPSRRLPTPRAPRFTCIILPKSKCAII